MRNLLKLTVSAAIAAVIVSAFAVAGPGIGIAIDTNSLTGNGSNGNTLGLRRDCNAGYVLRWSGSQWACSDGGSLFSLVTSSDFVGLGALGSPLDLSTTVTAPGSVTVATTLGVTGLTTLTGGFTLGADSSAASHKITSLTNGSSAQDAAAFGQIGTAVNAAISGTATKTTVFTGTNAIGSGWATDDATSWGVSGKFLITEATGAVAFGSTMTGGTSGSAKIVGNAAASATVPTLIPLGTATTTGVGAQASGNLSLIASGAETVRVSTGSASVAAVAITSAQAAGGNLGSEILDATSWTSTGWTGAWSTGWIHTIGNTTALSRTMTNTIGQLYQIAYTVTGRTAGSFTVSLGGTADSARSSTGSFGPQVTSTNGPLVITPTTDFDGTIVVSVKLIGTQAGLVAVSNAAGAVMELRGAGSSHFLGNAAGAKCTTCVNSVGVGPGALGNLTTGGGDFGFGRNALTNVTTTSDNGGFGTDAGRFIADGVTPNVTPATSLFIGSQTKALADGQSNQVVIGFGATGAGSNTVTLGNTSVATTILQGAIGVDSASTFAWSTSSTDPTTTKDTGLARNTAGVLEINNGTAGTLRDLTARNSTLSGTQGVTGLSTLTGGFTLGADSSAGSHKITSLTNGSSAQDAAAFGQIAAGVNAAVSGTTGTVPVFSGTNAIGNSILTQSGGNQLNLNGYALYIDRSAGPNTTAPEMDYLGYNGRWTVGMDTANTTKSRDFVIAAKGAAYSFEDGATTSGSPTLTSAAQGGFHTSMIGRTITGAGIPGGTTVTAVASSTSLTMSANATATASSVRVNVLDASNTVTDFMYVKHRGARRPAVGIGITSGVPDGTYQLTVEAPVDETMGAINAGSTTSTGVRSAGVPYAFEGTSGTVSITNAFTGATGQNTVLQFESGTSMNTSGDGQRILFTRGGTSNYNAYIASTLSATSPAFVNPRLDFVVQDAGTIGIANTHTHLAVTSAGADVTGALTVSSTASITGDIIAGANIQLTQATNQYVYSSLATSTGDQSINIDSAGTGGIRINSNTGGVGNAGSGGVSIYGGNGDSSANWTIDGVGNTSQIGTMHVGGNFDVATSKFTVDATSGDVVSSGAISAAGNAGFGGYASAIYLTGKIGTAPTVTTCGTSPTQPASPSSNISGKFTTGSATGTTCTLTFVGTLPFSTPLCFAFTNGGGAKQIIVASSTTATTATWTTTLTSSTAYNYVCLGGQG